MTGVTEPQVLDYIHEYLQYATLCQSADSLRSECTAKGKHVPSTKVFESSGPTEAEIWTKKIDVALSSGNREAFFKHWDITFPAKSNIADPDATASHQKVEFFVAVYFAVYTIHPFLQAERSQYGVDTSAEATARSMTEFKAYFETRGAAISKSTAFLPFYALPYVPDPLQHPSFREVFEEGWIPSIKAQIQKLANSAMAKKPELLKRLALPSPPASTDSGSQQENLKQQLKDMQVEQRSSSLKHRALQKNYHNLITIASELVGTLASCINGEPLRGAYLSDICQRLSTFKKDGHAIIAGESAASPTLASAQRQINVSSSSPLPPIPFPTGAERNTINQLLNYASIQKALAGPITSETKRELALLLQSLRNLLAKAPNGISRRTILAAYIAHDILGLNKTSGKSLVHHILQPDMGMGTDPIVQEQLARLLNVMASDCVGRGYLLSTSGHARTTAAMNLVHPVINILTISMRTEVEETLLRQNILGALQKLSLRRSAQSVMNALQVVPYLYGLLGDNLENLSEYTLEYGAALLMNLCLRKVGKGQSAADPVRALKVLTDLIEHDSLQVKTYVNGVLYSIFSEPAIREHAKAIGMLEQLKYLKDSSQEQLVAQINFVIEKLEGEADDEGAESDQQATKDVVHSDTASEDGEEDDREDEEEDELLVDETHEEEDLKPLPSELHGLQLLEAKYCVSAPAPLATKRHIETSLQQNKEFFTRPKTPLVYRSVTPQPALRAVTMSHSRDRLASNMSSRNANYSNGTLNRLTHSFSNTQLHNDAFRTAQQHLQQDAAANKKNMPRNRDELEDFERAFSTRTKLSRTPVSSSYYARADDMAHHPPTQQSPYYGTDGKDSRASRGLSMRGRIGEPMRSYSRLSQH